MTHTIGSKATTNDISYFLASKCGSLNLDQSYIQLPQTYTIWSTMKLYFCIVIGAGIFITVNLISENSPNTGTTILIWFICGLIGVLGTLSYIELAISFPENGGDFVYIQRLCSQKYADTCAFIRLWIEMIIIRPASQAAIALTFAKYLIACFGKSNCPPATSRNPISKCFGWPTIYWEIVLSIGMVFLIVVINCCSPKLTKLLSNILGMTKVLLLSALFIIGIYPLSQPRDEKMKNGFTPNEMWNFTSYTSESKSYYQIFGELSAALQIGLFTNAGWSDVNFAIEEIVNPSTVLPVSGTVAMVITGVFYVAIIVMYFSVMTNKNIADCGETTAATFVIRALQLDESTTSGMVAQIGVAIAVAMSCVGCLHGSLFTSSRFYFASSRWNHLPNIFSGIHVRFKTPVPSIIFGGVFTALYCLSAFSEDALKFLLTAVGFLYYCPIAVCICLLITWRIHGSPNCGSALDKPSIRANQSKSESSYTIESCESTNVDQRTRGNTSLFANQTRALIDATIHSDLSDSEESKSFEIKSGCSSKFATYKLPLGIHIFTALFLILICSVTLITNLVECGASVVMTIIAIPIYFICIKKSTSNSKKFEYIFEKFNTFENFLFRILNCQAENRQGQCTPPGTSKSPNYSHLTSSTDDDSYSETSSQFSTPTDSPIPPLSPTTSNSPLCTM